MVQILQRDRLLPRAHVRDELDDQQPGALRAHELEGEEGDGAHVRRLRPRLLSEAIRALSQRVASRRRERRALRVARASLPRGRRKRAHMCREGELTRRLRRRGAHLDDALRFGRGHRQHVRFRVRRKVDAAVEPTHRRAASAKRRCTGTLTTSFARVFPRGKRERRSAHITPVTRAPLPKPLTSSSTRPLRFDRANVLLVAIRLIKNIHSSLISSLELCHRTLFLQQYSSEHRGTLIVTDAQQNL